MCGILGIFTKKLFPDEPLLDQASWYLRYRGPDDAGTEKFISEEYSLFFSHTRLSIIDVSKAGHQPMRSCSGKTVIIYNGEIYNYRSVGKELLKAGCIFKSESDTEVILNAYELWGIETALQKLDGMFAFALYDFEFKKLFLCRDRFGKKPLYYSSNDKSITFSSDIRSVKKLHTSDLTIDRYSLNYFLSELSTPKLHSIFSEIKKVPPASYMEVTLENSCLRLETNKYWNLSYTSSCVYSFEEVLQNVERLLSEAVKKRLVADVRVAALLSGGIDSTLVVAKMSEQLSQPLNTYTVGFKEEKYDESAFAKMVSRKFQTNHTVIKLDSDIGLHIDNIIQEYGEPFGDSSMIPTYLICREVSKNEKVVLGGDGGDELFAGYDSYYHAYLVDKVKKFRHLESFVSFVSKNVWQSYRTNLLSQLLQKANRPSYNLLSRGMGFSVQQLILLLSPSDSVFGSEKEHEDIYRLVPSQLRSELLKVMNASFQTRLLNDYLVKVDRASMYASLEMRSPFLDKDLAEFAATLKPKQLYKNGEPKSILKNLASRYFDNSFIYRKKMGFGIPVVDWLIHDDFHSFRNIILSGNKYLKFNSSLLQQLLDEHISGLENHQHRLWLIYVFNRWASFN